MTLKMNSGMVMCRTACVLVSIQLHIQSTPSLCLHPLVTPHACSLCCADDATVASPPETRREGEQTNPQTNQQPTAGSRKKAKQQKQRVNTSVYVTGLPDDVTEAELAHVFRKCGLIKEDDEGHPRVKVYRDKETGRCVEMVCRARECVCLQSTSHNPPVVHPGPRGMGW